jgi:hypothetical protein
MVAASPPRPEIHDGDGTLFFNWLDKRQQVASRWLPTSREEGEMEGKKRSANTREKTFSKHEDS